MSQKSVLAAWAAMVVLSITMWAGIIAGIIYILSRLAQ